MTRTYGYHWLRKQAADHPHLTSAMEFLKVVGVVPQDEEFTGRNWLPRTNLDPNAISARYLAEFANDWDELGESSPGYFIEALEFECAGSEKRDVVAETLMALGEQAEGEGSLDSALAAA
jgi:hypothetical protein